MSEIQGYWAAYAAKNVVAQKISWYSIQNPLSLILTRLSTMEIAIILRLWFSLAMTFLETQVYFNLHFDAI